MKPEVAHSIIIHQPTIMDEFIENALAVMAIIAVILFFGGGEKGERGVLGVIHSKNLRN